MREEDLAHEQTGDPVDGTGRPTRTTTRLLLAALEIQRLLIREPDCADLLPRLCHLAAEKAGLPLVWIGIVDDKANGIRRSATGGRGGAAEGAFAPLAEGSQGCVEPAATAIREGRSVAIADIASADAPQILQELAASHGLRSCAAVPISSSRRTLGALALYSDEPGLFSEAVVELIEALAGDLARTLMAADRRAQRSVEPRIPSSDLSLDAIIDALPIAVLALDAAGCVTLWNRAAENLFGWVAGEVVGSPTPLVPGERAEEFGRLLLRVAAGEVPSNVEFHGSRRDGTAVDVALSAAPLTGHDGRYDGAVLTAVDLTEHQQLREQLRHAQKMEAVGRLAGGVAHDFNNLLQAMLSTTQLLRGNLSRPQRVAEGLRELEEQARRGAQLTRQLLLFSRRESAKREHLELNALVSDTARLLRRLLRENVELATVLADGDAPVRADRGQLEQVIVNLAVNGADAMPEGGRLEIATFVDSDGHVGFTVSDTGPGVPAGLRERVFEPFFTTKPAGKGTGLGLSVVLGIVEAHGGTVEITDAPGRGACCRVILPRSGSAEYAAVRADATPSGARDRRDRRWRVLVVEDEVDAATALQEILQVLGYEAVAVNRGQDALDLPLRPEFDVLLTDYLLPDSVGNAIAASLRQRWPGLAVVLMSGYTEDGALRKAVADGTVRFLQKPFDIAALDREIRAAIAAS